MGLIIEKSKRVFLLGSAKIQDPDPSLSLKEVTTILARNYPQFRWTTILDEDARLVGDELQYSLVLPPPKVNG